ncbi:hypothetical protein DAPPUDRAFT_232894 [Daphnia pulex]|uniref:Uncharacterized protein n=1 Tax=Daphnia pulex TaxID=6669 RepID=E9FSM7_DAPPU|nr:hypothetical protein DAPPUDRAFT_232894 [Daphnia pulex]|eukprot:EFX89229.1 hypothetical protein DAPPUDRAFT_232894 [Daphnia pulex]
MKRGNLKRVALLCKTIDVVYEPVVAVQCGILLKSMLVKDVLQVKLAWCSGNCIHSKL